MKSLRTTENEVTEKHWKWSHWGTLRMKSLRNTENEVTEEHWEGSHWGTLRMKSLQEHGIKGHSSWDNVYHAVMEDNEDDVWWCYGGPFQLGTTWQSHRLHLLHNYPCIHQAQELWHLWPCTRTSATRMKLSCAVLAFPLGPQQSQLWVGIKNPTWLVGIIQPTTFLICILKCYKRYAVESVQAEIIV